MKNLFFSLVFLIVTAQSNAELATGYYITDKGDTVKLTLDIPVKLSGEINFYKMQSGIEYQDKFGIQSLVNPFFAKEVGFTLDNKAYKMVALIQDSLFRNDEKYANTGFKFVQLVVEGKVKLFRFIDTKTTVYGSPDGHHGGGTFEGEGRPVYFLEGTDRKPRQVIKDNFPKVPLDFFKDCTSIKMRIAADYYKYKDIERMVRDYNNTCF